MCREHRMTPAAGHGAGERWQVRWRDENGVQRARNFAKKTGKDPETCADAFDAKIKTWLDDGSYVDPSDANTTFKAYAEDWRNTRTHDITTADRVERELAVDDVDFLRKVIHVRRQVRLIGNVACFRPVKNGKAHDVPLAESLAPVRPSTSAYARPRR